MKALSRESRLLIDAARDGDEPSAADRRRVRGALAKKLAVGVAVGAVAATATHGAAGGVTAAAGTTGVAASAAASAGVGAGIGAGAAAAGAGAGASSIAAGALATSFGAKLIVSAVLLGAMGAMSAGTLGYVRHEQAKRADARVAPAAPLAPPAIATTPPAFTKEGSQLSSAPPQAARPVAPAAAAPLVVAPSVGVGGVGGSPSPARQASQVSPASPASSPSLPSAPASSSPSDLDAELALLQEAHGALRMNDGPRALRLLDDHRRRFPNGALAEESEAARVFALCQVGRADEARDVAGRFLREHARSPLAPRVARACDAEGSTF